MDMSSNSQLVIFDRLFVMVAEFEHSYIELNFLHVTIKAGEGGGQPFRDLSLLFMSLFQGGGEGAGQLWTMSLILHFFKSFLISSCCTLLIYWIFSKHYLQYNTIQ